MRKRSNHIPAFETLTGDIYFRHEEMEPVERNTHAHIWGQLSYVSRGLINLEVAGKRFLSPPHYAIWIPPGMEHAWSNSATASYRAVYLSPACCGKLPVEACALGVSDVLKAILSEFARLDVGSPATPQERRMALVALDQIEAAAPVNAYLPYAASTELKTILQDAENNLHKRQTTEQVARAFNLTTRTLERRCASELGIGFGEWRQRLRFTLALEALGTGQTIQQIAFALGYRSPSAFISMFRRLCGQTPEQYRRSLPPRPVGYLDDVASR
jgi:AraC-like DNA-binding protein